MSFPLIFGITLGYFGLVLTWWMTTEHRNK